MFKKSLTVLMLCLLFSHPAQALPGQAEEDLQSWATKHKFLSTWFQEILDMGGKHYLGYRELEDQWFIDIHFQPNHDTQTIQHETLFLLKKKPVPQSEHELVNPPAGSGANFDGRKWKDVECRNIWQRDNQTAQTLLKNVYGEEISKDFANSKLTYKGVVYAHPLFGFEGSAHFKLDEDGNGSKIPVNSIQKTERVILVYLGQKYAYTDDKVNYSYNMRHSGEPMKTAEGCGLRILSLSDGKRLSSIYSHNQRVYNELMKAKNKRDTPASIKID